MTFANMTPTERIRASGLIGLIVIILFFVVHTMLGALAPKTQTALPDEALQLTTAEREALAGRLFDSLETDDPDAEAAWDAEIEKRINEMDRGKVEPIPWTEATRMIFGKE